MRFLPVARRSLFVEILLLAGVFLVGCAGTSPPREARAPKRPQTAAPSTVPTPPAVQARAGVMLGIDVLEEQDFRALRGKRIGLLTHPAAVNRFGVSTLDVIRRDKRNNLVALFGVEHGIYGTVPAGEKYEDHVDERTGLKVYSLYTGRTRWPMPEQLATIDVLVIDLQDIGSRSYTFISAMRYAVEACFEKNVEVVVLDRPNPLGGLKVAGPMMDADQVNYLGAFRVPYVHGMTMGELARMAASEPGVLMKVPARGQPALTPLAEDVLKRGRLTVVTMRGWSRAMTWPQTGLRWVPTSPNIPSFDAVVGYPMTGLGAQLGGFRHGIGTPYPFRLLTHQALSQKELLSALQARRLPGLRFSARTVTLPPLNGAANGTPRTVEGVYVEVADWAQWQPTDLSLAMMQMAAAAVPPARNPFATATPAQAELFNKHVGSAALWQALKRDGARLNTVGIAAEWQRQAGAFQQQSRRYWFYR